MLVHWRQGLYYFKPILLYTPTPPHLKICWYNGRNLKHDTRIDRSSYQTCSVKKLFLKTSQISQENRTSVLESRFNKVLGLGLKLYRFFPEKFAKFLGTRILKNICKRLLLNRETYVVYNERYVPAKSVLLMSAVFADKMTAFSNKNT